MRDRALTILAVLAILFSAATARADEIRLKDGTKISGTIVGFENDSFRVETSYGFALIQKDKVADINISAPKKDSDPKAKSSAPPAPPSSAPLPPSPTPAAEPALAPAVEKESASAGKTAPKAVPKDRPKPVPSLSPAVSKSDAAPPKTVAAAAPAPAPPPPPAPPEPPMIRDEIRGNLYANFTYGFQMFKPPSWDLIPEARKALPDAIAALGTYDQTTLLVIGRERTKDSLDLHAATTSKALSSVYENFRMISNKHVTVAGLPAVEQHSRGTADGRDWSVTLLTLLRGNDAFTLLGMTWADSDLIQVQENVIAKTVNSLTFAAQQP
ncbi:MAG: hypothetical protein LAO19_21235 [Acidobacteriia bacterium]|nr:hypothetical protein [Terriglobia bacterium]